MNAVPILAGRDGHAGDRKEFVEFVERGGKAAAAGNDDRSADFHRFIEWSAVKFATPVITTDIPYNASYIKAEKLGIVNNNWNENDLRKLAASDEYINNCINYRKYLPTEYKAEQFLKVKGLI